MGWGGDGRGCGVVWGGVGWVGMGMGVGVGWGWGEVRWDATLENV